MRQYIEVQFAPGGRPYTYHNDGPPVAIGDRVKVSTPREGEKIVVVSGIDRDAPPYTTKAILGLADKALL